MAYQHEGTWFDLSLRTWSTHHHLHAASVTIALRFTPFPSPHEPGHNQQQQSTSLEEIP